MAYCKKFFLILFILFILLFNFNFCFADEGDELVDVSVVNGISISSARNYFNTSSGSNVGYFPIEIGYVYYIKNNNNSTALNICTCNETPALNVQYNYLGTIEAQETYSYIGNNEYLYFSSGTSASGGNITVTRKKLENFEDAVGNLVENVGPNALWGVFGSGIDFVFVVVIVAFGIFIIFKLIKGLSKGKSKI